MDNLNENQNAAVTFNGQHCLVLAGAGSGKTRVIIQRVAWLLKHGTPANRIVVITFTRRAAREILERVTQQIGRDADRLRASTFHAFCLALIRRYSELFGLKNATIIDPDDAGSLFKLVRASFNDKSLPKASVAAKVYSYARNCLVPIADACRVQDVADEDADGIVRICQAYENRKRERQYLDYDDILAVTAKAIELDPRIRAAVINGIDHLLIDEMQDTNPLQWQLINQLKASAKLFCVGDEAQSIYAFRGADIRNILDFSDRVPGAVTLKLEDNYRSFQEILDLGNWLLDQSPLHYEKRLRAVRGRGAKPVLREFISDWQESDWIAADLKERYNDGARWRDLMILVRSGWAGRGVERALLSKDIPYVYIGGTKLLESAHVRDVLSAIRVVSHHGDDLAWMRLLQLFPKIGEVTAEKVAASLVTLPSLEHCIAELHRQRKNALSLAAHALEGTLKAGPSPAKAFKAAAAQLESILEVRYKNDSWDMRKRDFGVVEKLAQRHESIRQFIDEYLLDPVSTSEANRLEGDDAVTLITIHSAKGTEKRVCYLPGVNPGQFPHSRALESEAEVEEERRVMYVAVTRAMDELILTRSVRSYGGAADQEDDVAQERYFLRTLPDALIDHVQDNASQKLPPGGSGKADFRSTVF